MTAPNRRWKRRNRPMASRSVSNALRSGEEVSSTSIMRQRVIKCDAEYTIPSKYSAVRESLSNLLTTLREAGVGAEDTGTIELVLAEALNNVVEHAYKENPDCNFVLTSSVTETGLSVRMTDQGVPMPGLALPSGNLPEIETGLQDLPEGGFGWALIHTLTEELTYERIANQNVTSFVIPMTWED